jgi:hypothetical protein
LNVPWTLARVAFIGTKNEVRSLAVRAWKPDADFYFVFDSAIGFEAKLRT